MTPEQLGYHLDERIIFENNAPLGLVHRANNHVGEYVLWGEEVDPLFIGDNPDELLDLWGKYYGPAEILGPEDLGELEDAINVRENL